MGILIRAEELLIRGEGLTLHGSDARHLIQTKKFAALLCALFFGFFCAAQNHAQNAQIKIIGAVPKTPGAAACVLQTGSFKNPVNARVCYETLKKAGLSPEYEAFGEWTRVLIPRVAARDVPRIVEKIWQAGFKEVWIRPDTRAASKS